MRGKIILIVCSGILANISLMICFRDLYLTLNFKIWWNNSILIANAHTCELFQLVITKKHSFQNRKFDDEIKDENKLRSLSF